MEVTIRNPHERIPLTERVARSLGFEARPDSSGLLAAVYEVANEAEVEKIRAKGLVVEQVRR